MYFTVEKLEGTVWVPKIQFNFEDVENFKKLATKKDCRIMYNKKDITKKYRSVEYTAGESTKINIPKSRIQRTLV